MKSKKNHIPSPDGRSSLKEEGTPFFTKNSRAAIQPERAPFFKPKISSNSGASSSGGMIQPFWEKISGRVLWTPGTPDANFNDTGEKHCWYGFSSGPVYEFAGTKRSPLQEIKRVHEATRGFLVSHGKQEWVVDDIFDAFRKYGFSYHVGMDSAGLMLGHGEGGETEGYQYFDHSQDLQGNCMALAKGFKWLLNSMGIPAEDREVRTPAQPLFLTNSLPNFISSNVNSNILPADGFNFNKQFIFSNHTATFVNGLNKYYDPMAGEKYANINSSIASELVPDPADQTNVYRSDSLNARFTRTDQQGAGSFLMWRVEPLN